MDYIIAIDGPSGVGKSTIAKKLSKILKINYIDTGAMYRAIAYKVISNNISLDDHDKIKKILEDTDFTYKSNYLYVDGVKLGKEIRTDEISKGASLVSSYDYVRNHLVSLQRKIGMEGSCVLDGRDVGTVIFPNADFKFYLTASSKERAKRRFLQSERKKGLNLEQVRESIEKRDFDDMNRSASPLKKAKDAIEIDSTNKTLKETILEFLSYIRGENNELRLRRMIRIIKISMVYQILVVPIALLVTSIINGAFYELSTNRILSFFALFAAIGSAYLLIGTQMQYKNLLELNKKSKQ